MKLWTKAILQGAACGLVLGMVLLIAGRAWWPQVAAAQAEKPAVAEVVRARRFEVVDAGGKMRALLTLRDGNPSLMFSDAAGEVRVHLTLLDGNPSLSFSDAAGKSRVELSVFEGHPHLVFYDAAGKVRADLSVFDGNPSLELSDKAGVSRAVLGATSLNTIKTGEVTTRPESSLVLFDKDGKVMWIAP
jgi:hypothetical protein